MSSLLTRNSVANFQSHYAFRFEEQSLEEDDHNGRHNEGKEPVEREVKHSYLTSCKHVYNKKISSFLIINQKKTREQRMNQKKNLNHLFISLS
jgi:hypothetical protein